MSPTKSLAPSYGPSYGPSAIPSSQPSFTPSTPAPTGGPSTQPSLSTGPTIPVPTSIPSSAPSAMPTQNCTEVIDDCQAGGFFSVYTVSRILHFPGNERRFLTNSGVLESSSALACVPSPDARTQMVNASRRTALLTTTQLFLMAIPPHGSSLAPRALSTRISPNAPR